MTDTGAAYVHADETRRVRLVGRSESPDDVLRRALGPSYDEYRRKWARAESFIERPIFPLHLDVDTNVTCNLKCVMCPAGQGKMPVDYPGKMLDFDLYQKAIDEGAGAGLSAVRLGITGEPLLRPDIVRFVDAAKKAGILDIMLITNGMLLSESISRSLIDAGLTRLMVSIDAVTEKTYAQVRPGGSLGTVTQNVLRFLEMRDRTGDGLPLLRVSFVRMSINNHEKKSFESFWSDKAEYVSVQEYSNILESVETDFHAPDRVVNTEFRCADPWTRMSLFVNGDLYPCCADFGRLAPIGNLNTTGLSEAWNSEKAKRLAEMHRLGQWRRSPICRRCAAGSTAAMPDAG